MNELAHSTSSIEQVNKYYVQCVFDNGLHPVTWLSCPCGRAIIYFLSYVGVTNQFASLKLWPPWVVPKCCLAHGLKNTTTLFEPESHNLR